MKRDPIKHAVNIITDSILDALAADIEALNLRPSERDRVLSTIEMSRIRKRPGRAIKDELKCTRLTKSGMNCGGPKCNGISCWGHMSAQEREEHRSGKKRDVTVQRSSTASARALEDLANE